jgi:hypothetical protein
MTTGLIKSFLFGLLFLLLLVPFLQDIFSFVNLKPLVGAFIPSAKEEFNKRNWFEGDFQKSYERWYEENIGLRNFLIRSFNQVDYSLFNTLHGDVVAGKKGYLFQQPYLDAHIGKDFIGEANITSRMERINYVTQQLALKGIHVMIVIAPTKADFFSEYVPSFYSRHKTDSTNYECWREKLAASTIPYIDFNDYFLKAKDTSRYALFPKNGIHWSYYGMYLVADSLLKLMREKTGIDLKKLNCEGIEMGSDLNTTDYDLARLANLLFDLKNVEMPYPVMTVEDNQSKKKPNVLVIGDSFYWNIYNTDIPGKIFNGPNFWYYNYQAYTDSTNGPQKYDAGNCMPVVEKQQVVLILQTVSNLNKLGFDFFENAYVKLNLTDDRVAKYEKQIRDNPEWLKQVIEKAEVRKIPVDSMIKADAAWMVQEELNKNR